MSILLNLGVFSSLMMTNAFSPKTRVIHFQVSAISTFLSDHYPLYYPSYRTTALKADSGDITDEKRFEYVRRVRGNNRESYAEESTEKRKNKDDRFELDDMDISDDEEDDDDDFDGIIPNNILDQIDPDGVVDRLPELFSDPRFWRDAVVVMLLASYAALDPSSPLRFINADDIDYSKLYAN